jgi:hypothetical protein
MAPVPLAWSDAVSVGRGDLKRGSRLSAVVAAICGRPPQAVEVAGQVAYR